MCLTEDIEPSLAEADDLIAQQQRACQDFADMLARSPTMHDLELALSGHAQSCRACGKLLHTYLQRAIQGAE